MCVLAGVLGYKLKRGKSTQEGVILDKYKNKAKKALCGPYNIECGRRS
ncbi:hypothetical protein DOT_0630 [Desulfosporosinus sp. OT]|nr:hypothetical protein DOT_0630 [Desulfosporosinus sp. OT]